MSFCRALGLFLVTLTAYSQEWKAGVSRVDITPGESIWLAGYGARTKPSEGVQQHLYAKALALQDGINPVSVIVTSDLLGFSRSMALTVADRVRRKYGMTRDRLVLNASHTHSGPVTGQVLRPAYDISPEQVRVVERYTARLLDQVVELIGAAIADLSPSVLAFEQGYAGFAVNRRRVGHREYPGVVDHDVPVMTVRALDGKLRAVMFGYSCHATVLAGQMVSGDWPGYAQEVFEKANAGATALFLNGCGADSNPLPRRSVDLAQTYGSVLATAAQQVMAQKMVPVRAPLRTAFDTVDLPLRPWSREEFEARLKDTDASRRRHAEMMLGVLKRDGKLADRYPYPVQVWQFGQSLKLITLGGEVVADYSLRFKKNYGPDNTWVAGYSNDVFAYIPSLRVLREGGYEGGGAMIPYGQPGPFGPAVEEIIAEKVDELVRLTSK